MKELTKDELIMYITSNVQLTIQEEKELNQQSINCLRTIAMIAKLKHLLNTRTKLINLN